MFELEERDSCQSVEPLSSVSADSSSSVAERASKGNTVER